MSSSYGVVQPSSLFVLVSSCIRGLETCIEMLLKQMRQINVRLRGQRFVTWRTSNESTSNRYPSNLNKIPMVSSFELLFCRKKSGQFGAPNCRGREDADSQLGGIQNHWP